MISLTRDANDGSLAEIEKLAQTLNPELKEKLLKLVKQQTKIRLRAYEAIIIHHHLHFDSKGKLKFFAPFKWNESEVTFKFAEWMKNNYPEFNRLEIEVRKKNVKGIRRKDTE